VGRSTSECCSSGTGVRLAAMTTSHCPAWRRGPGRNQVQNQCSQSWYRREAG
jgi:hypothetical protein